MAEYGVSTDIAAGTRRVATALLLVFVGGAVAFFDVDFDGLPLVPDPLGHALVAIAGVQLASHSVTGSLGGQRLRAVGRAMAVVAILSAAAWLAALAAGPPPPSASGGTRLTAALLVSKVAVGVWFLTAMSAWCADQGLPRPQRRLRRAAHVVGWTYGPLAVGSLVAATVAGPGERTFETPLAVPLVFLFWGALVYASWGIAAARMAIRALVRSGASAE